MPISANDIKHVRSLQQKKFRKESGLFVVEGIKTVQELINSNIEIDSIYATEEFDFLNTVDPNLIHVIKQKELERISGLRTPNGLLAVAKIPETGSLEWNKSLVVVLDGINDPGNLGTIIRTAKWFGIDEVICSENCADAYDRKVVQSTMGALFHVKVHYTNLIDSLQESKSRGYKITGAGMSGKSIYEHQKQEKQILVIGSESHGISDEVLDLCDDLKTIPNKETSQKVESLNAGIATAIFLSELTRPK